LHPAVCASAAWLSFPLSFGIAAAAAAAVVDNDEVSYSRSALCESVVGNASSLQHTDSMTETWSRLLFCLVSWVSRIPSFGALAQSDQVKLHNSFIDVTV